MHLSDLYFWYNIYKNKKGLIKMYKLPQRQVHLDFHTSEAIDKIGSMFNKEQFINCLKKGHVNSITIFAKCHHGWAYFPSKTNQMHPGLSFDLLSAMLEACKEAGVAAPIYVSAGFDEKYAVEHPEDLHVWSQDGKAPEVTEKNGVKYFDSEKASYHLLCMNTPYLDVLKSQVEEVVERFMPEGIFLDIVAQRVCYCERCRKSVHDLGWDESDPASFVKLGEITYKKYVQTINDAARSIKPDIRIFHNGGHIACGRRDLADANTHLELESLPTGGWGYDHFPKSARYVWALGKEYLGMTGKFHLSWGEFGGFKHPNALRYEVALSLANGAKCSVGDQMHPYGFLDDATYELIGEAYSEAEKVEEYCYDVQPIADVGLLSVEAVNADGDRNSPADVGACRMLLEGKYLYDVLDAECDFSRYKVIILPDKIRITDKISEKLRKFVENGGKLLCSGVSGTDNSGKFVYDFGVDFLGESKFKPTYYHPSYNALGLSPSSYVFYNSLYETKLSGSPCEVLGHSRATFFNRAPEHFCSHQHTPFKTEDYTPSVVLGKDGGYIAWDIFSEYATVGSIILKDTVHKVLDNLLKDIKTLRTNLPTQGVVVFNKQPDESRYVLHMLYATPTKRGNGVEVIEDLIPIAGTSFDIRVPEKVKSVVLVPQNKALPFEYKNGICSFTVDEFTCSQVVSIEIE